MPEKNPHLGLTLDSLLRGRNGDRPWLYSSAALDRWLEYSGGSATEERGAK